MIILLGMALVAGIARVAAPAIRTMVIGKELSQPGMTYVEAGRKEIAIDGIWAPDEIPLVVSALKGEGDKRVLEVGEERVNAVIKAGCPACPGCRKIYPGEVPVVCTRCKTKMPTPEG